MRQHDSYNVNILLNKHHVLSNGDFFNENHELSCHSSRRRDNHSNSIDARAVNIP